MKNKQQHPAQPSPGFIIFRCALALSAAAFYYLIEGSLSDAVLFGVLFLISSLPLILIAFFVNYTFPYRYGVAIPFLHELLEIDKTAGYPFHAVMGAVAVLLVWPGDLISREVKNASRHAFFRHLLRVLKWLLYLAGFFMLVQVFLRSRPVADSLGWTLLLSGYATALSRLPGLAESAAFRRGLRIQLARLGLILLLTLALLEICVRLTFPAPSRENRLFEPHPEALYALSPDAEVIDKRLDNDGKIFDVAFRISSQGWRDDYFPPKEPGEFRILCLGDSYTMGYSTAFSESIPNQLAEKLQTEDLPFTVRVINGGVMGTCPWQQLIYLRERGLQLEPDLVLHQIFPPNDIENSLIPVNRFYRAWDPGWHHVLNEYRRWHTLPVKTGRWFRQHCWSYYHSARIFNKPGTITSLLSLLRFVEDVNISMPLERENRPSFLEDSLRDWYPEIEEGFSRMQADILALRAACDNRDIDYIAWNAPDILQFDEVLFERFNAEYGGIYVRGKSYRKTEMFFREENIPHLDVFEVFHRSEKEVGIFFVRSDGHYSPAGCTLIAEALKKGLMTGYFSEKIRPPAGAGQ
jgi:hypothetical protein